MDVSWEELDDEMCLSLERMLENKSKELNSQVSFGFSLGFLYPSYT
jgi:hypothetical protein